MKITGQIVAVSHIFYVKPKIFFVEIQFHDQRYFLTVKDRSLFWQYQKQLVVRKWVEIENLNAFSLYEGTEFETYLWEISTNTKIQHISRPDSYPGHSIPNNSKTLLTYEGLVTEDDDRSCGFYVLDEHVYFCTSNINLISNIPILKKGETIRIHHAHKTKLFNKVLIYACGRTFVTVGESSISEEIFPKQPRCLHEDYLQHYALNQCCNIHVLYSLFIVRKTLTEKLDTLIPAEDITRKEVSGRKCSVLAAVVNCITEVTAIVSRSRSLPREFLCHGLSCLPSNESAFPSLECWTLSSEEIVSNCSILDLWQPQIGPKAAENEHLYWLHEIASIKPGKSKIILLVGVLRVGPSGYWLLEDKHGQIECIIEEEPNSTNNSKERQGSVAVMTSFTIHRETFLVNKDEFVKIYISVSSKNIHLAGRKLPNPLKSSLSESTRFTLLHKSSPQALRITAPAKRDFLGYFLVVSLSQSIREQQCTKRARIDQDNAPVINCLFFMTGPNSMQSYPFLHSGHVYGISEVNLADQLIREANAVPCLRDISKELKSRFFILPPETIITEETENLSSSSLFMKDVLDVEECFKLDIVDEIVSLRGKIADRFHVDPKFSSEKGGGSFSIQHQSWFGIPGNRKLVIKLGSCEIQHKSSSRLISVYILLQEGQLYPVNIHHGVVVEVSWISLKKTRDTNRIYGISTALTRIKILNIGTPSLNSSREMAKMSLGRKFFAEIDDIRPGEVFITVLTIRYINKISIRGVCSGCGSSVLNGHCSYAGCHWTGQHKTELKAWCTVEDGSGRAVIYFHGEICRQWMKLSPQTWNLLEHFIGMKGELVYPSNKITAAAGTGAMNKLFEFYCKNSGSLRGPFSAQVRKFRPSKNDNNRLEPYYLRDCPTRRLFCLEISQLDAAQSASELLLNL